MDSNPPDSGQAETRQYLFVDDNGAGRPVPLDPANVERQMRDLRAAGHRPYLIDEDELIDLGRAINQFRALNPE